MLAAMTLLTRLAAREQVLDAAAEIVREFARRFDVRAGLTTRHDAAQVWRWNASLFGYVRLLGASEGQRQAQTVRSASP